MVLVVFGDFSQIAVFVIAQTLKIATFVVKNRKIRRQIAFFSLPNHRDHHLTTKKSPNIAVFVVAQTLEIASFVVRNRRIRRQGCVVVFVVTQTPEIRAWGQGGLGL